MERHVMVVRWGRAAAWRRQVALVFLALGLWVLGAEIVGGAHAEGDK